MRTPRVYARINWQRYTASTYYRLALPIYFMKKLNLPIEIDVDGGFADRDPQTRWMHMMSADFNLNYQQFGNEYHKLMVETRTWEPKPTNGEMRWPPTFIFDTDDDINSVLPMNDAFGHLGYKDHNGNVLADGSKIWVRNEKTGEPQCIWSDGDNIDFKANRANGEGWALTMREADLITTTTPKCAQYVLREGVDPSKVHVFPNCINFEDYPSVELRDHPDEVRILWQGSVAHREDLFPLRESFGNICAKYPNVKWVFWGVPFQWITDFLPPERVTMLPWVHHYEFISRLTMINHDISIAPLQPYIFNQSRSAIKFYESSAIHRPAATLAQRTGEYPDVIIEGETGLLFSTPEEFETKLGGLIEDSQLRTRLAANAKDWVRTHRDPNIHVPKLLERWMQAWEVRKLRPVEKVNANRPVSEHKRKLRRSKNNRRRVRQRAG